MADGNVAQSIKEVWDQIVMLGISGAGGAYFRAILAPEQKWNRRIVQGVAGALSAIFLGGIVGHIIEGATGAGAYSFLAAGFLMGSGGEVTVKAIQDRFLGKSNG